MIRIEIPYKFPSLNDYTYKCRSNKFAGATMKRKIQQDIGYIINTLPEFKNPIKISFTWVEGNKRRDLDNVCFAKKFILDAMVECGKMKDDNRNYVVGFTDSFEYGKETKVILKIDTAKSKFEYDHAKVWDTEKGIKEYFKKVVDEDVKD